MKEGRGRGDMDESQVDSTRRSAFLVRSSSRGESVSSKLGGGNVKFGDVYYVECASLQNATD